MQYHAHVYFDLSSKEAAEGLRGRLRDRSGSRMWIGDLVPRCVGPHRMPMFELNFDESELADTVAWLMLNRAGHPVLVHPVTGHDPKDHSDHAMWLGAPVPLDFSRLDPPPAL